MEYTIIHSDLESSEIKPSELLKEYVQRMSIDNHSFFPEGERQSGACPACRGLKSRRCFEKCGFHYVECTFCETKYVNPRPTQEKLDIFYRNSPARKFWMAKIWRATSEAREKKILTPLIDWIQMLLGDRFNSSDTLIADLMPNHPGVEETWDKAEISSRIVAVDSDYSENGEDSLSLSTNVCFDAVILLDTLGRVEQPGFLLEWVREHLEDGGLCFITTIFATGLDLLTLGEASEVLIPPDRLNVFSYEGMQILLEKAGMEIVEMSTPGVLDLRNIRRGMESHGIEIPEFFRYILARRNDSRLITDFQDFLQRHRLSSLGRIVLRKNG